MKSLNFEISKSGTGLGVVAADANATISQYQVARIVVTLNQADFYPNKGDWNCVLVHLEPMGSSAPTQVSDYSITMHLLPDPLVKGRFTLFLNEALGNELVVGSLNHVYYNFELYYDNTLISQPVSGNSQIGLYKTNVSQHYAQDDLGNAFAALDALEDRLNG